MAALLRKMVVRLWGSRQSTARVASTASTAPGASVLLATAEDIQDAAAQWSLALRRIATIELKMGADLKRGWIGSRSGPARGERLQMYHPHDICPCPYRPLNRGLPFAWSSMDARYLRGVQCLAAPTFEQKTIAQIGFGQCRMSWSRASGCCRGRAPRRGRCYAVQVIRMRKRLAMGPERKMRRPGPS
jgi:hypothetical protein